MEGNWPKCPCFSLPCFSRSSLLDVVKLQNLHFQFIIPKLGTLVKVTAHYYDLFYQKNMHIIHTYIYIPYVNVQDTKGGGRLGRWISPGTGSRGDGGQTRGQIVKVHIQTPPATEIQT